MAKQLFKEYIDVPVRDVPQIAQDAAAENISGVLVDTCQGCLAAYDMLGVDQNTGYLFGSSLQSEIVSLKGSENTQ